MEGMNFLNKKTDTSEVSVFWHDYSTYDNTNLRKSLVIFFKIEYNFFCRQRKEHVNKEMVSFTQEE